MSKGSMTQTTCAFCGKILSVYQTVLAAFIDGKLSVVCLDHEGMPEYEEWAAVGPVRRDLSGRKDR